MLVVLFSSVHTDESKLGSENPFFSRFGRVMLNRGGVDRMAVLFPFLLFWSLRTSPFSSLHPRPVWVCLFSSSFFFFFFYFFIDRLFTRLNQSCYIPFFFVFPSVVSGLWEISPIDKHLGMRMRTIRTRIR